MTTMLITERQAFMALSGLIAKDWETTLCSDEYLFMIELAKFADPHGFSYNTPEFIERKKAQAEIQLQEEKEEEEFGEEIKRKEAEEFDQWLIDRFGQS